MKKKMICGILIVLLLLTGCGKETKQKEAMKKAGEDYYNRYGKQFTEIDEYSISLEQLRDSVKTLNHDYDLSDLEMCQDDSRILFSVDNGKIIKTEYQLHC